MCSRYRTCGYISLMEETMLAQYANDTTTQCPRHRKNNLKIWIKCWSKTVFIKRSSLNLISLGDLPIKGNEYSVGERSKVLGGHYRLLFDLIPS